MARLTYHHSRTLLQIAVCGFGFVPVLAGGAGALLRHAPFFQPATDPAFDSHLHYLSGLLLGIGLLFWSLIPRIETCNAAFRLLTFIVVTGGLSRLLAVAYQGWPSGGMIFGLGMELGVTPALCLWQHCVSKQSRLAFADTRHGV